METATASRTTGALSTFLAGLQAGMIGVLWMLLWLGLSAAWQQRSFWSAENLMATGFFGAASIHSGFALQSLSGLALYLVIYSVLGALLALVLHDRLPRRRILLASAVFGVAWYYLAYHLIWKSVLPLVALLHVERPTILGHLLYGLFLGRYPRYLPAVETPVPVPPAE